jgi:alkylation response protein AidB-like acyl-CoA dehydrogenase
MKESNLIQLFQFGAIRSKLAEMATSCIAGESASYRAAKDIEDMNHCS